MVKYANVNSSKTLPLAFAVGKASMAFSKEGQSE